MANIKSFPNNQDEYIGAEYVMKWLHGRTSGVFAAENNAAVSAVQNEMAVTVSDGVGWIADAGNDGIVWWNDHEEQNGTKLQLAIDTADSALNRIDRIIVEWKTTNYVDLPEIKVLKGTVASNPTAPALTNNGTVRQLSLARVYVAAGTIAITASMITDERLDAAVCGIVTESVSVDTSMANAQFTELLERVEKNLVQLVSGQIPDKSITKEKLVAGATYTAATATLTANGWANNQQTVNVSGVTASNLVMVAPAPATASPTKVGRSTVSFREIFLIPSRVIQAKSSTRSSTLPSGISTPPTARTMSRPAIPTAVRSTTAAMRTMSSFPYTRTGRAIRLSSRPSPISATPATSGTRAAWVITRQAQKATRRARIWTTAMRRATRS